MYHAVRKVYNGVGKVYHGVSKVYHGVRKVYHGVRKDSHGFMKIYHGHARYGLFKGFPITYLIEGSEKLYHPLIHAPLAPQ